MTPEERDKLMARYMRSQLERAGVTDQRQQDATLQYIQDELDARDNLQESSNALTMALRNKTATDSQFAGLLNTYLVAVEDDRARRTTAQKKLGETLEMTKFPRLEATLALMGLWDDAPNMGGRTFTGRGRNGNNRGNDNNAKPAAKPDAKPAAKAVG